MYSFFVGGQCRLEPVTARRPMDVVKAELLARFGNRGRMTVVADITDRIHTGLLISYGKPHEVSYEPERTCEDPAWWR